MEKIITTCPECANNIFENTNSFATTSQVESVLFFSDCEVDSPLISIVIPTFNSRQVIDAIKSALDQKDAPVYEVVIVDNHSEDSIFRTIIDFVKAANSKRIRLYQNEDNIGMYGNWNRCLELAKANHVTFLHSDDLLMNSCLKDLWECHLQVENDAAIIGLEEIRGNGNKIVSIDKIPQNHLFGFIKGRYKYKKGKINLLTPGGNGCGHLLNKESIICIGGYSKSGDCGCMLRYQLKHPVYNLYRITRVKRIGENESRNAAKDFAAFGYHIKLQVIAKYFNNNVLLRYISRLEYENTSFPLYGVTSSRELFLYEKAIIKLWHFYLYIKSHFSLLES